MATEIFFKHLFTSIKRRPAQPILLMVVMVLAVTVCIASLDIAVYLPENEEVKKTEENGRADYIVATNSLSPVRFISAESARNGLPEGVDVCGVYGLPLLYGEDHSFVYGASCEFAEVGKIFDIEFTDISSLRDDQKANALFATEDFAEKYGISIGESVTFTLFGQTISFNVFGITRKKFMATYDVLFDTSGLTALLQQSSFFFSAYGEEVVPSSVLYICSNGKEVKQTLQTMYPYMSVRNVDEDNENPFLGMKYIVTLITMTAVLFVVMVIYCCFHVITVQRREETNLFYSVGAKRYMLDILSAVELFLYWVVGGVFGVLLSTAVAKVFINSANLTYCTLQMHPKSVLLSLSLVLFASEASLFLSVLSDRTKKKAKTRKKKLLPLWICLCLTLVFTLLNCFIPIENRKIVGIIAYMVMHFTLFLVGKNAIPFLADLISEKPKNIPFRYALKNARTTVTFGNSSGILSVLFILIFSIVLMINFCKTNIIVNQIFLPGDFLVLDAGEGAVEALEKADGVENVYPIFKEYGVVIDRDLMVMSTTDRNAFSPYYAISDLPKDDEMYCDVLFADEYNLTPGQTVSILIGSRTIDVKYTKSIESIDAIVLIDADYWGFPMNYLSVEGTRNVQKETLYTNIMTSLVGYGTTVIGTEEFTAEWVKSISAYALCIEILMTFILVFAGIGIGDSIVASYISRKEEFDFYYSAGMGKKDIRKMKLFEMLIIVGIGIILFLLFVGVAFLIMYKLLQAFGIDLFFVWKEANVFG